MYSKQLKMVNSNIPRDKEETYKTFTIEAEFLKIKGSAGREI